MNENGTCHFFKDKAQFIKVPPVRVGDYLWTDVGEDDEVVIGEVKVVSITENEQGYDICLGEGLGEHYRITEEDIGESFFKYEEQAKEFCKK